MEREHNYTICAVTEDERQEEAKEAGEGSKRTASETEEGPRSDEQTSIAALRSKAQHGTKQKKGIPRVESECEH